MSVDYEIEELSLSAWPSLQTELYDGWVLRFAEGHSKRSNSVSALYPGRLDLGRKIEACEEAYAARGLPTVFKLLACPEHEALDRELAERGYAREGETAVRTLDLIAPGAARSAPARDAAARAAVPGRVGLGGSFGEDWLAAYCRASGVEARAATVRRILSNIGCRKLVAAAVEEGRIVGCGYGAIERGWVGLFDIVVAPESRRRGLGREIVASILDRAAELGARRAYLQVVSGNAPAEKLYHELGFRELYRYWYRLKAARPLSPGPAA